MLLLDILTRLEKQLPWLSDIPGGIRARDPCSESTAIIDIIGEWFAPFLEFSKRGAAEIKRRPEVEVLLVTGDSRIEVKKKRLNWLVEG
jgi:hypothetical protein